MTTLSLAQVKHTLIHILQTNSLNKLNKTGSAGAVVANRLAANRNLRVLLLEAGGAQTSVTDAPALAPALVNTEVDWQYRTLPQMNIGRGFPNARINQPKGKLICFYRTFITEMYFVGKVIGGTSSINWMLYNRGNRRSYDNWVRTYGATGWDYNSVLPYFIRSENNTSPTIVAQNYGYHGTSGPMGVSPEPRPDQILYLFQKQMNSFGIPTLDINGANQLGTMIYELTVKNGIRSSTGNAYIDPNPYPNNLHIMINSLVTRILFNNTIGNGNPRAFGVEFRRNGVTFTVQAIREVIVSAGCIASPQLLMLSGVGPRSHLQSFGIPVVADLPVGNNFQDHVYIHHYYEVKNTSLINELIGPTVQQYYDFYVHNKGRLTELPNSITFFSTNGNDDPNWPNAVIDTNAYNVAPDLNSILAGYGPQYQSEWADFWRPYLGKQYVLITSAIYRTYSRGTVRLASTDPTVHPLIDPQYLSDRRDMEALVNMTKMLFYMTQTGEFAKYATIFPRPIPGCSFCPNVPMWKCDSYVRCIINQVGDSALHPGGACRMGSTDRTDIVVDPSLRVRGIDGLRVIDSSIIPELANANTHAASVMIGERGAQIILDALNGMTME